MGGRLRYNVGSSQRSSHRRGGTGKGASKYELKRIEAIALIVSAEVIKSAAWPLTDLPAGVTEDELFEAIKLSGEYATNWELNSALSKLRAENKVRSCWAGDAWRFRAIPCNEAQNSSESVNTVGA